MLPYLELHRDYLLMSVVYGTIVLFTIVLVIAGRELVVPRRRPVPPDEHGKVDTGPIPLLLVLLYLGVGLWATLYVLAFAVFGFEFAG